MVSELAYEKLRRVCTAEEIGCESSAEVTALETIIGQERAVQALQFGLEIKEKGFNIYVAGIPGSGRTAAVERFLEEAARSEPVPDDWCYVNNFHDSYSPEYLRLPAGRAAAFATDMEALSATIVQEIRHAFESDEYTAQKDEMFQTFQRQKQAIFDQLKVDAEQQDFSLQATPMGLLTIPIWGGKPLSEEEFMALKPEEKAKIGEMQQKMQVALEASVRQAKALDKEAREALVKLDEKVGLYAISHLMDEMRQKYQGLEKVLAFIAQVQADVLENLADFRPQEGEQPPTPLLNIREMKEPPTKKYRVNVLVDHSRQQGAPVVSERNPTYQNLMGRVEQEARFGMLVTDFTLIRPGALHRANGGYLVLPIEDVLRYPLAWESLKRALENSEIVIEDAGEKLGFISTKSLRPQPVPLDVKVILIGRPIVYQRMLLYDEQFNELFKVKADFDTRMPRTPEHVQDYVAFASMLSNLENLRHLDASALARLVEHGSRLAEDQEKLSTHFGELADVLREASFYAVAEGAGLATGAHVSHAIEARLYRSGLTYERVKEAIQRGAIQIEVRGERVGQVNGLAVVELGDISFGQPAKITASLGLGKDGVLNIEREAQLSGSLHTKGVLILTGFLAETFGRERQLALSARLAFEQSYNEVEGDSASSTELYAILSALADLPIRQGVAVTGSVNQWGEVQAVGAVNEKVEGFFDICQMVGLDGGQGVLIPVSNMPNLMLKEALVAAVKAGQFHIWPVESVAQGIEVLTGVPAGERNADGKYPPESVFGRVERRLRADAKRLDSKEEEDEEEA
jgi:lon-related putative ATP-dependent protease